MIALLVAAAGLLMAGACCSALLVSPGRRPMLVRGAMWSSWLAAGAVAATAVVVAGVRLGAGDLARNETGEAVADVVFGLLEIVTAVSMLGLFGFWAAIRHRATPRARPGSNSPD